MVQAWYQGGISVVDFTDSDNPRELAWFDRGPLSDEQLQLGGSWSAYWYNGYVYSNDIQQGFDVLKVTDRSLVNAEPFPVRRAQPAEPAQLQRLTPSGGPRRPAVLRRRGQPRANPGARVRSAKFLEGHS